MTLRSFFCALTLFLLAACGSGDDSDTSGANPINDGPLAQPLRTALADLGSDPEPAFTQLTDEDAFLTVCASNKALKAAEADLESTEKTLKATLLDPLAASLQTCDPAENTPCHSFEAADWALTRNASELIADLTTAFVIYEGGRTPQGMEEILAALLPVLGEHMEDYVSAHNRASEDGIKAEADALRNAATLANAFVRALQGLGVEGFAPADLATEQMGRLHLQLERLARILAAADLSTPDNQPYLDLAVPTASSAQQTLNNLIALHVGTKSALETCSPSVVFSLLDPINTIKDQTNRLNSCVQAGRCVVRSDVEK